MLTRRAALTRLLGASVASLGMSNWASLALAAAATEQRLVVVILRGGMDGLAVVPPYGDAGLRALRGDAAPPPPGQPEGLLDLGGFFGLHPALAQCHAMYTAGEMLVVQAVAGPYRERSHFKAQDCLESGSDHRLDTGWLNRALEALPKATSGQEQALAVGVTVPLLLRGPVRVSNWSPGQFAEPQADLIMTIAALNASDPVTGPAMQSALDSRGLSAMAQEQNRNTFPAMAKVAGEMLGAASGPRIAVLELGGWDTHAGQTGRLISPLRQLDQGLGALRAALGPAWARTACTGDDRVRPHCADQRDPRHRPWHRLGRLRAGWRGGGRPRGGGLAGPGGWQVIRGPGSGADHRPAGGGEGGAGWAPGHGRTGDGGGVSRQRRRAADAGRHPRVGGPAARSRAAGWEGARRGLPRPNEAAATPPAAWHLSFPHGIAVYVRAPDGRDMESRVVTWTAQGLAPKLVT